MLDWLITFILLFIGFIVLVTGFIQVLYIGWLIYLLIVVVMGARIWADFISHLVDY